MTRLVTLEAHSRLAWLGTVTAEVARAATVEARLEQETLARVRELGVDIGGGGAIGHGQTTTWTVTRDVALLLTVVALSTVGQHWTAIGTLVADVANLTAAVASGCFAQGTMGAEGF